MTKRNIMKNEVKMFLGNKSVTNNSSDTARKSHFIIRLAKVSSTFISAFLIHLIWSTNYNIWINILITVALFPLSLVLTVFIYWIVASLSLA